MGLCQAPLLHMGLYASATAQGFSCRWLPALRRASPIAVHTRAVLGASLYRSVQLRSHHPCFAVVYVALLHTLVVGLFAVPVGQLRILALSLQQQQQQ